jgi:hypothetical protein
VVRRLDLGRASRPGERAGLAGADAHPRAVQPPRRFALYRERLDAEDLESRGRLRQRERSEQVPGRRRDRDLEQRYLAHADPRRLEHERRTRQRGRVRCGRSLVAAAAGDERCGDRGNCAGAPHAAPRTRRPARS